MKKIYLLILVCISIKVEAQTSTFSYVDSLIANGRYQKALTKLKSFTDHKDISYYKIGNIYASIDDYKNASNYYKKSLQFKESTTVRKALARSYQKTGRFKKAINTYDQLQQKDSSNLFIKYQLAKLYFVTNDLSNATKVFNELSKKDVNNPNYYYQLGLIGARKLNGNLMLDNFLKAYRVDSTHIKSVYQLAKTFAQLRRRDSARLFTNKGLELDSLHVNLNKLKINSLFRIKEYNQAINRLNILDTIVPNDIYVNKMLGRSYFNIDSLNLAEKHFKIARKLDKEDFKIDLYLGHIYKLKKEYRKSSFNYFMATSKGKKERSEEYYSIGMLYVETKKPKLALRMFDLALKENRNKYKAFYQKALTSDSFYKDKNIAYELYDEYILRFEERDKDITAFVINRMKEIKKERFMNGEKVE